jgi:hypothetical protein
MRQDVQAVVDAVDSPADPLGHPAVSLPVLRQKVPPEIRHEETHLHPHRYVVVFFFFFLEFFNQ